MAAITASMVAELRAKTDAPMMECKKALTEAEGNLEKAEEILRVKLGNKAGKAASRMSPSALASALKLDADAAHKIVRALRNECDKCDKLHGIAREKRRQANRGYTS